MNALNWAAWLLPLNSGWRSDALVLGLLGGVPSSDSDSASDDDDELCSCEAEDDGEGEGLGVGWEPGAGVGGGPASEGELTGLGAVSDKRAAAARFDRGSAAPMAAASPLGRCVLGAAARAACCLCRECA